MATYNKFQTFVGDLGDKAHDLDADTLRVYLTNAVPSTSADSVKTDLVSIAAASGYSTVGSDITNTWSETAGVGTLAGTDVTITASEEIGPFRYVVLYNDTSASDSLIAWWDYGSEVTLAIGEEFTVDFGASILTVE